MSKRQEIKKKKTQLNWVLKDEMSRWKNGARLPYGKVILFGGVVWGEEIPQAG